MERRLSHRKKLGLALFFWALPLWAGWSHIEYGAANYGATRQSEDRKFTPGPLQHSLLVKFLREKVAREGAEGIFYVNDLEPAAVHGAAEALRADAEMQGWSQLQIIEYPGDYTQIPLPETTSARNSHPHGSFFKEGPTLEKMIRRSKTGLEIVTHYFRELSQFLTAEGIYRWERLGQSANYRFPSGRELYMPKLAVTNRRSYRYQIQIAPEENFDWIQDYGSDVLRRQGELIFHWGTPSRSQRVFGDANEVTDLARKYLEIQMHSSSLVGAGFYFSDNPYYYRNYGSELFALRFNEDLRFFEIPRGNLNLISRELKARGWFLGIRDPAFHGLLRRRGYAGLRVDLKDRIDDRETLLFQPRGAEVSLHRGDTFFSALVDQRMVEEENVLSYANTFVLLNYAQARNHLAQLLEGLTLRSPAQASALTVLRSGKVIENRTFMLRRWSLSEKVAKSLLYRCEAAIMRAAHWLGGRGRNFPDR